MNIIDNIEEMSDGFNKEGNPRIFISRKRWVIVKNGTEIFCGLSRNYDFKPFDKIGNTAIKTYQSKKSALSSFQKSWFSADKAKIENNQIVFDGNTYTVVEVTEVIK